MTEVEKRFLMETVGVVVCTSGVVKIREQVPFFREFSILFIEDILTMLLNFEGEAALKYSALLVGSVFDA